MKHNSVLCYLNKPLWGGVTVLKKNNNNPTVFYPSYSTAICQCKQVFIIVYVLLEHIK